MLLTRQHLDFLNLEGGYTGSSESTLVKIPDCRGSNTQCSCYRGINRKRSKQSTNAGQKIAIAVFSIAISRQSGDKLQSKTLFLTIYDLRSSIVLMIAAYPVWFLFLLIRLNSFTYTVYV